MKLEKQFLISQTLINPIKMDRTPSGIHGLDSLIGGGFIPARSILLAGSPGTGKTTFGLQFLCEGAKKGEPGVVLSLEETPNTWRSDMKNYGYDLEKLESENKIRVIDASLIKLGLESDEKFVISPKDFDIDRIISKIIKEAKEIGAKRILVDSLPALDILYKADTADVRTDILKLNYVFKANGMTTMLISEIPEGHQSYSRHGVEDFVADAVITLHYMSLGTQSGRTLVIRKMRGTAHSEDIHPVEFAKGKGIVVKKVEESI
jgi:KaiC/GvpD/RAD55 family RecA-like ATPase